MARQYLACVGSKQRHTLHAMFAGGSRRDTAELFLRGHRITWAQDVYPDEIRRHTTELRRSGVTILGVFPTAAAAKDAARRALNNPDDGDDLPPLAA
jgi:hypothetical protein